MKLTCAQMDILISFYLEGELSTALQEQVKEHLQECPICSAKYDIIETMFADVKTSLHTNTSPQNINNSAINSEQYKLFKNNLSAYIDNELPNNENIKIKKYTINNLTARKDLEESYNIRKLMSESFNKAKEEAKTDFSRSILRKMELEEENSLNFNPAIKFLIIFTISVLVLSTIVLISLNL